MEQNIPGIGFSDMSAPGKDRLLLLESHALSLKLLRKILVAGRRDHLVFAAFKISVQDKPVIGAVRILRIEYGSKIAEDASALSGQRILIGKLHPKETPFMKGKMVKTNFLFHLLHSLCHLTFSPGIQCLSVLNTQGYLHSGPGFRFLHASLPFPPAQA